MYLDLKPEREVTDVKVFDYSNIVTGDTIQRGKFLIRNAKSQKFLTLKKNDGELTCTSWAMSETPHEDAIWKISELTDKTYHVQNEESQKFASSPIQGLGYCIVGSRYGCPVSIRRSEDKRNFTIFATRHRQGWWGVDKPDRNSTVTLQPSERPQGNQWQFIWYAGNMTETTLRERVDTLGFKLVPVNEETAGLCSFASQIGYRLELKEEGSETVCPSYRSIA